MFEQLHQDLTGGINVKRTNLICSSFNPGRSSKEKRTTIIIQRENQLENLMDVVFFSGIKPWYKPWIEITYPYEFNSKKRKVLLKYFDSPVERTLLHLFCKSLPSAGKIYVSYENDDETRKGLMFNIPPVITRLGFLLFSCGCTWFKDWYFPEGGFEGGQKLQAEKALSSTHRIRQLKTLKHDITTFTQIMNNQNDISPIELNAVARGKLIMNDKS